MRWLQPPCPIYRGINCVPAYRAKDHPYSTVWWRVTNISWSPLLPTLNAAPHRNNRRIAIPLVARGHRPPRGNERRLPAENQGRTLDLCLVRKIPRNPDRPFATHYLPAKLVPQLLQTGHGELIKGGDFICVTDPADTSGNFHTRRALTEMICGLHLADASTQDPTRLDYTHYSTTGARIYITRNITSRMTGIDILPASFTDHNAVVLRVALGEMGARRSHPRWKLDPTMLRDADFLTQLRQQWSKWKMHKSRYPNVNIWWDRCVEPRLQLYLRIWGAESRLDYRVMEDHLYTCIYDIQKSDTSPDRRLAALNRYRAKVLSEQPVQHMRSR